MNLGFSEFKSCLGNSLQEKVQANPLHLYTIWSPVTCIFEHKVVNAEGPLSH